jgi:GEVED domain/Secretion system C-terminal sorting domain/Fibronectin type III domain
MKKIFTLLLSAVIILTANKNYAQCGVPVNLQVNFGNNVSAFTWDSVPGAISYKFQLKSPSSSNWGTLASGLTTNAYIHTGLFQSATFNWRVISFCSPTDSALGAAQTYTVPCEAPNTPIASNITGTTATLSWTPAPTLPQLPPSFTVSYRVLGSTGAWTLVTSNTTATSVNLTGLSSNTSYEWCVNKLCSYFNSNPLLGQFTTQYVPCDIPINLRTLSATNNQASLAWNQVNGWVNYYIQYKKATATNWTTVYVANNSTALSNLTKETLYDWRVMANCITAYQSVYSDVKQFTTYSNPCMAYGNNVNEGIDYFSLGSITRVSGKEIGGYYKSSLSTDLVKGSTSNTVTISAVYPSGIGYGDYYAVYIDYNKNGTFTDVGEQVVAPSVQITSQSSNYTSTFSVPNNTPLGLTKMRVILRRPGTAIVPCATGFQGEVEDYDVNIVASTNMFVSNNNSKIVDEEIVTITSVKASPNPSANLFNIELPQTFEASKYEISNIMGKIIQSKNIVEKNNFQVNLIGTAKGMYLLTIFDKEGNKQTIKLVLQ